MIPLCGIPSEPSLGLVIDAVCVLLAVISATGLVLWTSLKSRGKWGAALVLLGAMSAALLDYLFKSGASAQFAKGPALTRYFAIFYTTNQVLTFAVQAGPGPADTDRFSRAAQVDVDDIRAQFLQADGAAHHPIWVIIENLKDDRALLFDIAHPFR